MITQPGLLRLLNDASTPYRDPLTRLDWDGLDLEAWWLPPHALSLTGVPEFEVLPVATRRRLSHFEFIHLLEVGLWLEALFMRHLSEALDGGDAALRRRYLHEIREQAGHSLMFLELMNRSGVHILDAHRYRPPLAHLVAQHLRIDSALFWGLVVIGEELPDKLTRTVRQSSNATVVCAVVHQMATLHIMDEARHIALARASFADASQRLRRSQRLALSPALVALYRSFARYLFFPPPTIYQVAGFDRPRMWRERALANPVRRRHIAQAVKPTLDFLRDQGWRVQAPHG